MKVLWIAGWYPNQTEPYAGDFVQRHAQAVSLFHDVTVLFVTKDPTAAVTRNVQISVNKKDALEERLVYYYSPMSGIPLIGKLLSFRKYQRLLKRQIRQYISENGKPDLVHFYIGMRTGVIGKWITKLKIPYVVSEQWTGFLEEGQPNFNDLPAVLRSGWRTLIEKSESVHVVSDHLGAALERLVRSDFSQVMIPNVVNTKIFFPGDKQPSDELRLVFVTSQLDYQKNTEDILHALARLKQKQVKFQLNIFGPVQQEYRQLAALLEISDDVIFQGEKDQSVLASFFRQADALIIYSRFETFGCVIIEAFASGTPVVASDIPVLHENIEGGRNGIFVKGEDPAELADALDWLAYNKKDFRHDQIAKDVSAKYNFEEIGRLFSKWYTDILSAQ